MLLACSTWLKLTEMLTCAAEHREGLEAVQARKAPPAEAEAASEGLVIRGVASLPSASNHSRGDQLKCPHFTSRMNYLVLTKTHTHTIEQFISIDPLA